MPKLDYLDINRKFIDFTQKNIELIDFCLSIDSSYRDAFNPTSIGSSAYLITNEWSFDKDTIKDICCNTFLWTLLIIDCYRPIYRLSSAFVAQ